MQLPACLDMVLYLAYSGYDEPVGGYAFFLVMCILELITWLLGLITFTNPHMISTIAVRYTNYALILLTDCIPPVVVYASRSRVKLLGFLDCLCHCCPNIICIRSYSVANIMWR